MGRCQEWSLQACACATVVRDWCCQTIVTFLGDVRHPAGLPHRGGRYEHSEDRVRLPPWCHRNVVGTALAEVSRDSSLLSLWPRSCHEEWHEVLRMGKREGHFEVQQDGLRGCHCSTQGEQLPFQMGGLIKFDGDGGQATESSVRDTVLTCSHSCEC